MKLHRFYWSFFLAGAILFGTCLPGLPSMAQELDEKQLEALQQQIQARQKQLDLRLADAKTLETSLRDAEKQIAELVKNLTLTKGRLDKARAQESDLVRRESALQQKINQQQTALGQQLRSAYMSGKHDFTKMILNQENTSKLERMLSYYGYLNRARVEQIEAFRVDVEALSKVTQKITQTKLELAKLAEIQTAQNARKQQEQSHRSNTLAELKKRINSDAAQIEQLQFSEQNLKRAIERALQQAAQQAVSLDGLHQNKGQLPHPTKGKMQKLFNKRRQGQIRWNGVLFNGQTGDPVKSISPGKVLFADWLKGFGLVIAVDHGKGYMSLYGYNQALLKSAGDSVQTGEQIALVGQSGGQSRPALYFEIRYKGEAVNPNSWLKRY